MNQYNILIIDDEEYSCEILQYSLKNEGYKVDIAYSAEEALRKNLSKYNLFLLDLMIGKISGFRMARILRENPKTARIPIVFLTAKDSENDRLTGFALGADDFIAKPFPIREVIARIKAIFRRTEITQPEVQSDDILFGNLEMNLSEKKVLLNKVEISFTKKEFEILKLFLENRNRVLTRDEILSRVWTGEDGILNRTIDVNITRLRKKIGPYEKYIVTRLGYGYCFEG